MDFGDAIRALKAGHRVQRAGWNGKGMWLALTAGSVVDTLKSPVRGALAAYVGSPGPVPIEVTIGAHIDMRAADGSLVIGWLASQTDMLAEDWTDLDENAIDLGAVPRRCRVDQMTPAELAIREAMAVVEATGADVRLTDAVILLDRAQERVADFVDGVRPERLV